MFQTNDSPWGHIIRHRQLKWERQYHICRGIYGKSRKTLQFANHKMTFHPDQTDMIRALKIDQLHFCNSYDLKYLSLIKQSKKHLLFLYEAKKQTQPKAKLFFFENHSLFPFQTTL